MQEIELKILEINKQAISKKLLALGAKKIGTHLIIDEFFDFTDKRIKEAGETFRLRKFAGKIILTYKGQNQSTSPFKIETEEEIMVSDFSTTKKILQHLGLQNIRYREKKRTSFVLGKIKCEIDQYPTIPAYLEIEGSKKGITTVLQKLGYTFEDTTNKGATEVLKDYKVNPDFQKFED